VKTTHTVIVLAGALWLFGAATESFAAHACPTLEKSDAAMPGFHRTHIELSGSIYPAGTALFQIGKPAIPQLVAAIAEEATSDLVRNNVADAVSTIYRDDLPEGVAVLVRAARAQTDPLANVRLMDQARRQAAQCGNDLRNDCENAIVRENH
jgi:hypothetical protein